MTNNRILIFTILVICATILYSKSLMTLVRFSYHHDLYSYIFFIPAVSAYLIYLKKELLPLKKEVSGEKIGLFLIAVGAVPFFLSHKLQTLLNQNDFLSSQTGGWILCVIGAFIFSFGAGSFRHFRFPLLFLVFLMPIPTLVLEKYIHILQHFSADAAYIIFKLLNVPVFRQENVFQLPNFTMEVADECSGVRSSLVLWMTALLTGYLFLEKNWTRFALLLTVLPMAILKNAVRIVTLGLLASYVDPAYITNHWLHQSGGIVFFTACLAIVFFPIVFLLKTVEKRRS